MSVYFTKVKFLLDIPYLLRCPSTFPKYLFFFSYNVLLLNLFLTHDLVNPLHQVLDDTFRANLDLQTGGDGVCLDTRDSLSSNLLDLFLLFRSPLAWG